jgi:hypothetical protein
MRETIIAYKMLENLRERGSLGYLDVAKRLT